MAAAHAPANRRPQRFVLRAEETISLPGMRGTVVRCDAGRLWVTQAGDVRDYIVPAGAHFRCAGAGRLVVSALSGGTRCAVYRAPTGRREFTHNGVRLDADFVELARAAARQEMAECLASLIIAAWRRVRRLWQRGHRAAPAALGATRHRVSS